MGQEQAAEAFLQRCGRAIRQWRESGAQLSQEHLARRVQVSTRTVCRWEAGEIGPRAEDLAAMEALHPGLLAAVFPQSGHNLCGATERSAAAVS